MNSIDRAWRGGNVIGGLYYITEYDLHRVSGWMKGRLRVGDIAMCAQHSGDCFYDYFLMEWGENFMRGIIGSRFGSYTLSTILMQLSNREYHLIMAGEGLYESAVGEIKQNWRKIIDELIMAKIKGEDVQS